MRPFFIFFLLLLCTATTVLAQSQISGKILDKSNGETLVGAAIQIENTTNGTVTDIEGNFTLNVAPGTYTLVVSYISFNPAKIQVTTKINETSFVNVALESAGSTELKEVVIVATPERSSAVTMLIERKKAAQVSDGVTADLIRRTPDRTTSDVLKRVTGASIQEGKFAIIRGMNDRYNAGYLDGALLPSTESDRKAFAFDVVPANLIDNLLIIKAGSPDLAGDFGGGVIKINTKSVPDKFTQSFNIGAQMHSLTTFNDFLQFKKYGGEQFNLYGNQRNIPSFSEGSLKSASTFASSAEKARFADITKQFNNDWSNSIISASPNTRFSYSVGLPIKLSETQKLGIIAAVTYSNTRKITDANISTFDGSGQVADFKDRVSAQNISTGGILNINYVATKTQVSFRNLLNTNTDNNSVARTGMGNIVDDIKVQNKANIINYNRLYNGIVSAKHIIGDNAATINASVSYSNVNRKIPDYRIINYTQPSGEPTFKLALGDFFNTSTGRFASNLNENLLSSNFDVSKHFDTEGVKTEVKLGYFYQNRERNFTSRSFVYNGTAPTDPTYNPADDLSAKNISASGLYLVEKTSDDLAYYQGKSQMNAYFVSIDQKIKEKIRAVYGVRYEDMNIQVNNQKLNSTTANINKGVVLPSVNVCYSVSEKINVRADYFASVNRPEFRELAPFAFYVFDKNAEFKGNEKLQIAQLNNYDVRFEFFPTGGQLLSAGAFYKTINNPVELSIDITQPFTTFTYQNEKSAKIYGIELEAKKNLEFLGKAKFLSNMSLFANLSLIKSQLSFEEGSKAKQNRPLQGQSPYVVNAGLQYDNADKGWSGSLVVNRVGRRIAFVGVDAQHGDTRQDIYEAPRTVIDLQIGKTFKNINVKLTLGDILHNDLVFYQDANNDGKFTLPTEGVSDRQMFRFNNGFTSSLTFSYTF